MAGAGNRTAELLKKYNFPIQKKYGQNFLTDDNILAGIVDAAGVTDRDTVLEIGPGLGALTELLCKNAKNVIAVEIDRLLIPVLEDRLAGYDNITLINDDILKVDLHSLLKDAGKIKVVANLPYYITTPIVMELLERYDFIESITIMVQKEVAQRMQEGPGSKSYGALSLAVQYYSEARYMFTVSRNCFLPKPDVDSAVIRLKLYDPDERPVKAADPDRMFAIIRAAFNQRRKTLANALLNAGDLHVCKEDLLKLLKELGKSETIRGEALTLKEFAQISEAL